MTGLAHSYEGDNWLFKNTNLLIEAGEKIAVIGANGAGKTTFLKCLVGAVTPSKGQIKWAENANVGYYAQDHEYKFDNGGTLFEWMERWKNLEHDDQIVRATLGRLLFSTDRNQKIGQSVLGRKKGRLLLAS